MLHCDRCRIPKDGQHIVTHAEIAPRRKLDPIGFDREELMRRIGGQAAPIEKSAYFVVPSRVDIWQGRSSAYPVVAQVFGGQKLYIDTFVQGEKLIDGSFINFLDNPLACRCIMVKCFHGVGTIGRVQTVSRLVMSEQQPAEQDEWQALALRLTAFPDAPENVSGDGWWEHLVGQSPEVQIRRKLPRLQEIGPYASGRLVLTIESDKIDWRLVPSELEGSLIEDFPHVGKVKEALNAFLPLMYQWLTEYSPSLRRLAFGADLSLPVTSRSEGYLRLEPYLSNSVKIDVHSSQDLLYQINRPRLSKINIPNLRINRLSKWSVKMVLIGSLTGRAVDLSEIDLPFCNLEADINTASEFKDTLPRDQLPAIFKELVEMGMEIAKEGDIP